MNGIKGTVYLDNMIYEGTASDLTRAVDQITGGRHWMGFAEPRNGAKTFGVMCEGYHNVHIYVMATETDVITGIEVVPGAYGSADNAVREALERYIGWQLRYRSAMPQDAPAGREKTDFKDHFRNIPGVIEAPTSRYAGQAGPDFRTRFRNITGAIEAPASRPAGHARRTAACG